MCPLPIGVVIVFKVFFKIRRRKRKEKLNKYNLLLFRYEKHDNYYRMNLVSKPTENQFNSRGK